MPEATGDPSRLIGTDRIALERLVGAPDLKRREGPAEVWQYQGESCVMDAYLYPPAGGAGAPRVSYVEMRHGGLGRIVQPGALARCYAEVIAKGKQNAAASKP